MKKVWFTVLVFGLFLLFMFVQVDVNKAVVVDVDYHLFNCLDGCYFAEGLIYNQSSMVKPSELYNDCSELCWLEYCKFFEDNRICEGFI